VVSRARPLLRRPGHRACAARLTGVLAGACLLLVTAGQPARAAAPAPSAVQNAARVALDRGFRTGIAVLDLTTGAYSGAGEDTAAFPSESVVKVLIATQLLLTGQMTAGTDATAQRMITVSDDDAADALYPRAGGDGVVELVAAHYGIADLGAPPPVPGRWGLTRITARGLVELYAAIAQDPVVHPWLSAAMARAEPVAADGTPQFFGIPAATSGAAIKQGWGHDGVGTGNAVVNSTGYVDGGRVAVAILSAGPADTYGAAIQGTVTAQAQALLAGGAGSAAAAAAAPAAAAAGDGSAAQAAAEAGGGPATPLALEGLLGLAGAVAAVAIAVYGGGLLRRRLRRWQDEHRVRRARRRRRAAAGRSRGPAGSRVVRLPSGQLVCITLPPSGRPGSAGRPRPVLGAAPAGRARPTPRARPRPAQRAVAPRPVARAL
jgi:hypothetical protein